MTSAERQKLLLQQEIAKLSGRISQHASSSSSSSIYQPRQNSYHPYPPRRGTTYGASTSRGRGGRGGSFTSSTSLDLRAANRNTAPKSTSASAKPTAQTKVTAKPGPVGFPSEPANEAGPSKAKVSEDKEDGEVSRSPSPVLKAPPALAKAAPRSAVDKNAGWVKSTFKGNMSLMTAEKRKELQSQPRPPRKVRTPAQVKMLASTSTPNGSQQVVIDGIIFQFEPGGTKLTRIGELTAAQSSALSSTPTRKNLKWAGKKFRRTSKGNLISSPSRPREYCRFFTKLGRCERANTCPYKHDSTRIAICANFLRGRCPHAPGTCTLSHSPSPHNTPSCVRFQATSTCRHPACLYPHVRVSATASVCEDFAREGWCPAPAGTCPQLHVWECQEWREKGTCSRGVKCGLQHVLRASRPASEAKAEGLKDEQVMGRVEVDLRGDLPEEGEGVGFDDGASWIGLPGGEWDMEQGAPAGISGDEQSGTGEEESDDEDGSEDEDEEDEAALAGAQSEGQPTADDGKQLYGLSLLLQPQTVDNLDVLDEIETDTEDDEDDVLGVVL